LETNPLVEGEFKIEGEKFFITNETQLGESYMWDCEDSGMVGEYKTLWLANGNLLIQVESEECRNREDVFASEYVSVE